MATSLGYGFDSFVVPTVTAGAYASNRQVGGLLTFPNVCQNDGDVLIITGCMVVLKAAITPSYGLAFFNRIPTVAPALGDTQNYNLQNDSVDALAGYVSFDSISGAYWRTHGVPRSVQLDNLGISYKPAANKRDIYAILVDTVGATLTSTSDVLVRVRGIAA